MSVEPRISAGLFEQMRFPDCRAELWRGSIVRRPFHFWQSGLVVAELGARLGDWAREQKAGAVASAVGWWIEREPDTVLSPPIAFVSGERQKYLGTGFPQVAPDVAIEFSSWDEEPAWLDLKRRKYLEAGTREFWLVLVGAHERSNQRTVHVTDARGEKRVLTGDDILGRGEVLPGFSCSVRDIFSVL